MNLSWLVLWKNIIIIMKISLQILLIICLIFFFSLNISSCLRSDSSTSETANNNSDGRCEFAKTNSSQNSIESDNQSQKAFRLLLQSTFGPQKKDLDRVIQIGEKSWIDEQLLVLLVFQKGSRQCFSRF